MDGMKFPGRQRAIFQRMDRMRYLLKRTTRKRGDSSANNIEDVLKMLDQEGFVIKYYMTERYSRADNDGIDAGFILLDGQKIEFQIKSSFRGIQEHSKKRNHIPAVIGALRDNETVEDLKIRFLRDLNLLSPYLTWKETYLNREE